jgi:hypothetical protein
MIADHLPESQNVPATEPRCVCPNCGHVHGGYDQQASTLLDCLTIATDALREARRLVETEVLP